MWAVEEEKFGEEVRVYDSHSDSALGQFRDGKIFAWRMTIEMVRFFIA